MAETPAGANDEEPDDAVDKRLLAAWEASRKRFLAGHMEPELERHCVNVGRITVEFACLEEDIGRLLIERKPGEKRDHEAYMDLVMHSNDIPKKLRLAARAVNANRIVDLNALADDYWRFKTERDRYAHSSVGGSTFFDEASRMQTFKSFQQKHPKGASHPKGRVSDLPTDEETDKLCLEMREYRYALQQAALNATIKAGVASIMRRLDVPLNSLAQHVRLSLDAAIRPTSERLASRINASLRKVGRPPE